MTETRTWNQPLPSELKKDQRWWQRPTNGLGDIVQRHLEVRASRLEASVPDPNMPDDTSTEWGRSAAPKTVVVIDDGPDNVDLIVMVLESAGHTAHGTTAGKNGVSLAVDHAAHIVVLDYLMPHMNGAEVGKALRAHPLTRDIKIVMHSATPEATIRASFTQYDAYLVKPAPGLRLLQAIAAL